MIQCRRSASFALESFESGPAALARAVPLVGAKRFLRQEFDRYQPAQTGVFSFIDDTHSAAAKLLENAIVADRRFHCSAKRRPPGRSRKDEVTSRVQDNRFNTVIDGLFL